MIERLREPLPSGWDGRTLLYGFLSRRCSRDFLAEYFEANPDVLARVSSPGGYLEAVPEVRLAARLHELGLLPEEERARFAATVSQLAVDIADPGFFTSRDVRALLRDAEFVDIRHRVRGEVIPNLGDVISDWRSNYDRESEPDDYLRPLRDQLSAYLQLYGGDVEAVEEIEVALAAVSDLAGDLEQERRIREEPEPEDLPDERLPVVPRPRRSIFDDVDE